METNTSPRPDTAGSIMTTDIPVFPPATTCGEALKGLAKDAEWDDVHHLYITDANKKLLGYVQIASAVIAAPSTPLSSLLKKFGDTLNIDADQEKAVYVAVEHNLDAIPVINDAGKLVGAVTAKSIINVMHDEHVEDSLFATGIRRGTETNFIKLASARLLPVLHSRAPWLVAGALVGISLGFVSSQFEAALNKTLALAYFIPVIAYVAGSVGTQSEAITVRALATLKLSYVTYVFRELVIGFLLGLILGVMGGIGAWFISGGHTGVALVVGLSLVAAGMLATTLGSLIPIIFKLFGKDPALGSGPIATALQDILSILIYFMFALLILGTQ